MSISLLIRELSNYQLTIVLNNKLLEGACQTGQCSEVTPSSALRDHCWRGSRHHIWCLVSNPDHHKQKSVLSFVLSTQSSMDSYLYLWHLSSFQFWAPNGAQGLLLALLLQSCVHRNIYGDGSGSRSATCKANTLILYKFSATFLVSWNCAL